MTAAGGPLRRLPATRLAALPLALRRGTRALRDSGPALRRTGADLAVTAGALTLVLTVAGLLVVTLTRPGHPLHRAVVQAGPALLGLCLLAVVLAHAGLARRHLRQARVQEQDLVLLQARADLARRDERARIGADLHDSVVQDLAGVGFDLAAAAAAVDRLSREDLRETLLESAEIARDSISTLRSLLLRLAPDEPPVVDLAKALPDLAADLKGRGVKVDVRVGPLTTEQAGHELQALLYRAAQEGVRNVARHAAATRATISLTTSGGLATLLVEDDGHGMTSRDLLRQRAAGHVGLTLLADRVRAHHGELTIASEPGRGTRLVVSLPVRGA